MESEFKIDKFANLGKNNARYYLKMFHRTYNDHVHSSKLTNELKSIEISINNFCIQKRCGMIHVTKEVNIISI